MGQLGANLGSTWGQLGASLVQHGPTWHQLGVNLGLTWANLGQLVPLWDQLRPTWANMNQRRPTWGQLESNIHLKIIEKPLFFLGFFNISGKSLETLGNALKSVRVGLGDASGTPWEHLERPWGRLGRPWGRLGTPWGRLGRPSWRTFLGRPWESRGRASKNPR